jgi:transcriptional regulator with XRE-family HTH domain
VALEKKKKEKAAIVVSVGKAIARERKNAGLTQEKVAKRISVEKETVSRLESGDIPASLERLEQLSTAIGCPMKRFFWYEQGDTVRLAEIVAEMIHSLPEEKQAVVVRLVGELVKVLC